MQAHGTATQRPLVGDQKPTSVLGACLGSLVPTTLGVLYGWVRDGAMGWDFQMLEDILEQTVPHRALHQAQAPPYGPWLAICR